MKNLTTEIQINLINYKLEQRLSRQSMFLEWGLYVLVGVLVLAGIFLYNNGLQKQIDALRNENTILQAELTQSTNQLSSLQTNIKIEAAIKARYIMVTSLLKQQTDFVPVLEELGQFNGSGILLSNINVQSNIVKVNGYACGHKQLIELLHSLQDSEYLTDPTNLQISTDEDTEEISYSLQMSLEDVKE